MSTLPAGLAKLILPVACLFSKRVFQSVQVLLQGLAPDLGVASGVPPETEESHPAASLQGLEFVFVELPKFKPSDRVERRMQALWLHFLNEVGQDGLVPDAKAAGKAEGKAEGMAQAMAKMVRAMADSGMAAERISQVAQLPIADAQRLLRQGP